MIIHVSYTKGDYIIAQWDDEDGKQLRKTIHELRKQGYREIGRDGDYLNMYWYYRKKGSKEVVTVTLMCM